MVKGGMRGEGGCAWQRGHAWQRRVFMARGVCATPPLPGTPRDTVGQCAAGTHPTGMHTCLN